MKTRIGLWALLKGDKSKAVGKITGGGSVIVGVLYLILGEVNAKHKTAMIEIKDNRIKVAQVATTQAAMLATLKAIKVSIDETKGQVKITNARLWQIWNKPKTKEQ